MLVGNNISLVIYGIAFALLLQEPIHNALGNNSEAVVLNAKGRIAWSVRNREIRRFIR